MRILSIKNSFLFLFFTLLMGVNAFAQIEGEVTIESNENIKQLIAKKRAYNKTIKTEVYKIQLFYGSENSANDLKEKFNSVFPLVKSQLKFQSPDWKVWVGGYITRLEAARALAEIKEGFPSAFILSKKVKQ